LGSQGTAVTVTPNDQFFVADGHQIHQSVNQGATWQVVTSVFDTPGGSITYAPSSPSTMLAGMAFGVLKSTTGGAAWFSEPDIQGGAPNPSAIVFNPTNANTVYAGISYGWGLYMSTNGGSTWTNPLSKTSVYAVALNPSNPSVIYVGTQNDSGGGPGGVMKSTDGGATFQTVLPNVQVTSLIVDPLNPQLIYAGTTSGSIEESSTSGTSWSAVGGSTIVSPVTALAFDPQNPANIYAASSGNGVFFSSNGGASWSADNQGLSDLSVVAMAIETTAPYSVLAATTGGNVFTASIPAGSTATPTPTPTPTTPTPTPTTTPTPTPVSTPTPTQTPTPTPTPTTSGAQSFAPPRINAASVIHKRGRIKAIELLFEPSDPAVLVASDPLNVADASNVSSYQLLAMVRQKASRTIVVQPVAIASATYSHVILPASATYGPFEEVTLTLRQPIPQGERLKLTVFSSTSAIVGVHGLLLDGNGSGQPGSNYVTYL